MLSPGRPLAVQPAGGGGQRGHTAVRGEEPAERWPAVVGAGRPWARRVVSRDVASDGQRPRGREGGRAGREEGRVGWLFRVYQPHTCELRAGAYLQDMLSLLHTGISRCIVTTACVQRVENVILMYGKPVV